jgi:hypothetical protein
MIGTGFSTFNNASKVSGLALVALLTYSGCESRRSLVTWNADRTFTPIRYHKETLDASLVRMDLLD